MAAISPFRGWRYDVSQVGSLSDVTAPPYDVIGPQEQKDLYERHPCNIVRLILNRIEPGDDNADSPYHRAADFLRHWMSEGILTQEREEALYVYHQIFEWEGTNFERKGFLGRLRLEEFEAGQVFPHEQTMSGPKADRLKLTTACRMNLSPIFGLYPDDDDGVQTPLQAAIRGVTPLQATDSLGVQHRFWPVTDPAAINAARDRVRDKPVFIADGHHRYETALNYRRELRDQGRLKGESDSANFVLMHFVGMSDPGLAILPTHRLLSGLPELSSENVRVALQHHFEVEEVGTGAAAARNTWELMQADGGQAVFGFAAGDQQWLFCRLTDAAPMLELAAEQSEAWRNLGVSLLHRLVIGRLLKQSHPHAETECRYVHLIDEVNAALREKSCQLACLVAPAGIDHVREIASRFEKMPPKSTYFYPKLLSGLVLNPLE